MSTALILSTIVIGWFVVLLCAIVQNQTTVNFAEKWPPIDDDEFLRRCPPGTSRHTALTVRRIVAEQLGITYEQIYPEQTFYGDLDAF